MNVKRLQAMEKQKRYILQRKDIETGGKNAMGFLAVQAGNIRMATDPDKASRFTSIGEAMKWSVEADKKWGTPLRFKAVPVWE